MQPSIGITDVSIAELEALSCCARPLSRRPLKYSSVPASTAVRRSRKPA